VISFPRHRIHTGSGAAAVSYPTGAEDSFPVDNAAGAISPLPTTSSWRGA